MVRLTLNMKPPEEREMAKEQIIVGSAADLVCHVWFERDRKNLRLETVDGDEIFCLWDADVDDAIESGYLSVPRRPRPDDSDWLQPAIDYAQSQGLLKVDMMSGPMFEIVAVGFNGETDETDDRIIWVRAPAAEAVALAVEGTGATFKPIPVNDDADYVLPRDIDELREELQNFRESSAHREGAGA